MSTHTFNHILALSLSWHTKHKTSELLRILDRVTAVNRAGELIVFAVLPTLLDVAIAVIVFMIRFELSLGVLVGAVTVLYIWASVVLTRYRTRIRKMDDQDVVSTPYVAIPCNVYAHCMVFLFGSDVHAQTTREILTDGLLNYETVKYFGGEEYEMQRYAVAIGDYQIFERESICE
jgi:ATP-binding cassette subfamily B (MDR/TAP) protein 6